MDILINVIGFIVALFVLSVTTQHVLVTLFHQIPFMQKMSNLGVLSLSGKTYTMHGVRILIWIGVIIGVLYIPLLGVLLGAILGSIIGIRAAFDRENKNDMFPDYVKDAERNSIIIDDDSWETFKMFAAGAQKLQKELTETMRREKNNMKYFSFTEDQKTAVLRLTSESNYYFYQALLLTSSLRDRLLLERPEKWEDLGEEFLEKQEELRVEMQQRIDERDDILRECKKHDAVL